MGIDNLIQANKNEDFKVYLIKVAERNFQCCYDACISKGKDSVTFVILICMMIWQISDKITFIFQAFRIESFSSDF